MEGVGTCIETRPKQEQNQDFLDDESPVSTAFVLRTRPSSCIHFFTRFHIFSVNVIYRGLACHNELGLLCGEGLNFLGTFLRQTNYICAT
jgi:hypothetical protein